jgi:hypothetical protein
MPAPLFKAAFALLCCLSFCGAARAQNLVQNPDFANGLQGYISTGATAATFLGQTAAFISPKYGNIQATVPTTTGVDYIFTFLAASLTPASPTSFFGVFTVNGQDEIFQQATGTGYTQFSLSGAATGASTMVLVQTNDAGGLYLTSLDVQTAPGTGLESAPAPAMGAGMMSFCALVFAVRIHRKRREAVPQDRT